MDINFVDIAIDMIEAQTDREGAVIHQSFVITSGGVSTYAYAHATDTIVSLGWDLPDATVVEVSLTNGQPPQRVTLADLRAYLVQREIMAENLVRIELPPAFDGDALTITNHSAARVEVVSRQVETLFEVANPDAPVSPWERK